MKFMLFVLLATCGCVVFYRLRCAQKVNDWGSLTSPVIFPTQNDTESRVSPALRPSQGKELTCLKAKSAENPKYDVQQVNQCGYDCQTKKVWRAHDSSESTYQTFKSKCGDPQKDDVVYNPFEPGKCFRKRPSQWCGVVPPKSTFKPGYVLDFAGTWTKYNWDCDESGGRNYRSYAPSRGLDCAEFDRLRNKINSEVSGTFPSVDEEYYEWLDLVYAVMHAKSQFRMMEVGARYGTWGVRGFKLNQRTRDLNAKIVLVENNRENVGYIREHLKVNAIPESAVTVVDKACSTKTTKDSVSLFDLVNKHEGVLDLLDLDIQGSEAWAVPAAIEIINKKVRLIHIGTHGRGMHASLHKLLESNGWNIRHNFQQSTEYETTWEGKVAFRDGVLSAHNPKYLNDLQPAPNSGYSASLDSQKNCN